MSNMNIADKVTLIIPTLNEIDGIKVIMPKIKPEWYDQIIILDGGSTDGTVEYLQGLGYEVTFQKAVGLRKAFIENYANVKGGIMITFSPDGNSVPELIPDLLAKIREGYDMVIVSRYFGKARSYDDTYITGLANKFFTTTIGLLFGYRYTDAMVIYRAYRREIVEKLDILKLRSDFYEKHIGRYVSWEPQLSIRCAKDGLKISEIGGDEPKRIGDEGNNGILPSSRIRHFRVGLACLALIADELLRKRGKR
jgi:glycosyltransferase involved in cell wall biosynthesis